MAKNKIEPIKIDKFSIEYLLSISKTVEIPPRRYEHEEDANKDLKKGDILIIPENPELHVYEASKWREGRTIEIECLFIICTRITSDYKISQYPFFPSILYRTYYSFETYEEAEDKNAYPTYVGNKLEGLIGRDWRIGVRKGKYPEEFGHVLKRIAGKNLFINDENTVTYVEFDRRFGTYDQTRTFLNFVFLDTDKLEKIQKEILEKQQLQDQITKVKNIKGIYPLGFELFFMRHNISEYNLTIATCNSVLSSVSEIEQFENEINKEIEDILIKYPYGVRLTFDSGIPNLRTYNGRRELYQKRKQIYQANEDFIQYEKDKKLEPKYLESPYLPYILKSMDDTQKDYYKQCSWVSVRYSEETHSLLVIFAKDQFELNEFSFNDTFAYRTVLQFTKSFRFSYSPNTIRQNIIRKIIDRIEEENWYVTPED